MVTSVSPLLLHHADRVVFLRDGNIVDEMRDPDMDSILRVMAGMED